MPVTMLVTPQRLNKIVSHMPQVRREVAAQTGSRAQVARARLAAHHYQGHAKIESYVALTDGRGGVGGCCCWWPCLMRRSWTLASM